MAHEFGLPNSEMLSMKQFKLMMYDIFKVNLIILRKNAKISLKLGKRAKVGRRDI